MVVRKRRKILHITQQDLARLAGISVHAMSDIESGKGNPTITTLNQVLSPLGLEMTLSLAQPKSADA